MKPTQERRSLENIFELESSAGSVSVMRAKVELMTCYALEEGWQPIEIAQFVASFLLPSIKDIDSNLWFTKTIPDAVKREVDFLWFGLPNKNEKTVQLTDEQQEIVFILFLDFLKRKIRASLTQKDMTQEQIVEGFVNACDSNNFESKYCPEKFAAVVLCHFTRSVIEQCVHEVARQL